MGSVGLTGIRDSFDVFTRRATNAMGHPITFCIAVLMIVLWIAGGPFFGFSDSYQMVINTATTIVTFLMCFAIQATQNRSEAAIQVKLNEIVRAIAAADNRLIGIEQRPAAEVEAIQANLRAEED